MKKTIKGLIVGALFTLGFVSLSSCNNSNIVSTREVYPVEPSEVTTAKKTTTYKEVSSADVEDGDYSYLNGVLKIDNTNKKVTFTKYNDYDEYKAGGKTPEYNESFKYVEYEFMELSTATYKKANAIYFVHLAEEFFIYKNGDSIYLDSNSNASGIIHHTRGLVISKVTSFVTPTHGTYVSNELEQYKVDESGNRISNGDGGFQKEKFYLFLELTATEAKIYNSDNNTTHGNTPLHSISNYKLKMRPSGLYIEIPHTQGEFKCSLVIESRSSIGFVNAYEKHGDYSGSGDFVLLD